MDQRSDYADRDLPPTGLPSLQRLAMAGFLLALLAGFVILIVSQVKIQEFP